MAGGATQRADVNAPGSRSVLIAVSAALVCVGAADTRIADTKIKIFEDVDTVFMSVDLFQNWRIRTRRFRGISIGITRCDQEPQG